ncbi:MAG: hypothetical protein U0794_12855 [Isosphaeraceae bacterium]
MASDPKKSAPTNQSKPAAGDLKKPGKKELTDDQLSGIAGGAGEFGAPGIFPTKESGTDEAAS